MKEQNQAFNLDNNSFTPTPEQTAANTFAIQRNGTADNYATYAIDITAKNIFSEVAMAKQPLLINKPINASRRLPHRLETRHLRR